MDPGELARNDQTRASLTDTAELLGHYFDELRRCGLEREAAVEIVQDYHRGWLDRVRDEHEELLRDEIDRTRERGDED